MKGVAVVSTKGGVGKSTLCHLLALGASGWRGVPAYLFHTDDRKPMTIEGRPYAYIDGRDPERFKTVVDSLLNNDGFCIIDGGGNRPEFDKWVGQFVDLVLIPVTADEESISLGIETMERFQAMGVNHARYILSMTSANKNSRQYDATNFFSRLNLDLVAGEIKRVEAVKQLTISDNVAPWKTPPSNVNNLSRKLHTIVDDALQGMSEGGGEAISA